MYEFPGYDHRITGARVASVMDVYGEGFAHGLRDGYRLLVDGGEYPTVLVPYEAGTEEYFYYDSGYEGGFEQGLRGDV